MEDWQRTFIHEMNRRRIIQRENPDRYRKIWMSNPKGLFTEEVCDAHVWVPATHLSIHDLHSKSYTPRKNVYTINDILTRGFSEAASYIQNGYQMTPQICWKCDASRVLVLERLSTAERLAKQIAARPRKQRGRKITQQVESVLTDDFFE